MFLDKKLSILSELYYLKPGPYPSITDIIEAMITPIQERHNHSENCITVKVPRRTQRMRFTMQMQNLDSHSLVRTWDTFSEVRLAMNLE